MKRLAAALLGLFMVPLVWAAPAPAADVSRAAEEGFQQISQCLQSRNDLAVLLVVDESGSLQDTDPADKRARLLASLVRSLGRQAGQPTATGERRIDLAISTFAGLYTPFTPWTPLDKASSERIANDVEKRIPDLDSGTGGTNHPEALRGARRQMADFTASRRAELPPCTVTILFTDGVLTVSDIEAENKAAADEMCKPRGVVDGVRRDGINLVTVMLFDRRTAEDNRQVYEEGRNLLKAAAEGKGGSRTCGTVPIPEKYARGAYLEGEVDQLASLFSTAFALSNGTTQVQREGTPVSFTIDEGIANFTVIGLAPQGIELEKPDGKKVEIPVDAVGDQDVKAYWDFDNATVDVSVTEKDIGEWTVYRPGQSDSVGVFLDTGLGIKLDDVVLVAGQPAEISGRIVHPGSSDPVDLSVYGSAEMTGAALGQPPTPLPVNTDGTFTGTITPDSSGSLAQFDVSLDLTTKSGLTLVPVAGRFQLPVTLPKEFPKISPSSLTLSPLIGGEGRAEGALTAVGSAEGPTQVCVGSIAWDAADDPSIYSTDAPAGCFDLAPGEQRDIPVSVTTSQPVDEQVAGSVSLELTSAKNTKQSLDVPVAFTATRPLNQAVRLGVVAVLAIVSLLVPMLLLYLFNRHLAKFRPPDGIRGLTMPASLSAAGITARQTVTAQGGPGGEQSVPFGLPTDKLRVIALPDKPPRSMAGPDGSELRTHVPLSVFGTPTASVAAGSGMRVFSSKAPFVQDHGRTAPASFGLGDVWYATVSDADLMNTSGDQSVSATVSVFVPPRGHGDSIEDVALKIRQFPHYEAVLGQLRAFAHDDAQKPQSAPTAPAPTASTDGPRPKGPGDDRPAGPGTSRPAGPASRPPGPGAARPPGPGTPPAGPGQARPAGPGERPPAPGSARPPGPGERPPGPGSGGSPAARPPGPSGPGERPPGPRPPGPS